MSHGTEHHLEEAEHARHHAHDPFDRRVAVTMAIIAALLAGATLQSHRAHNENLRLHIQANDDITAASNQWGYYQAKKNRQYLYEAQAEAVSLTAKDSSIPDAPAEAQKRIAAWKDRAAQYGRDAEKIKSEAEGLDERAREKQHEADAVHHRADRFDYGHLGLELALVVCSVALLTRLRGFWYAGMVIGVIGTVVAASGLVGH